MPRFVLLNLKTYGLKSLEHEIELQFYNKNIDDLTTDKSLIKAIYGTNGEGKTAIAYTLELYKNSIISDGYLTAQSYSGVLENLINQHRNEIKIDLYFAICFEDGFKRIFHHIIKYQLKDGRVVVSYEKISDCKGTTWGNESNETVLLETKEGEIISLYKKAKFQDEIRSETKNLLENSSAVFPIIVNTNSLFDDKNINLDSGERAHLAFMAIITFALSLNVFIDKEDQPRISTERLASSMSNTQLAFNPLFTSYISDMDDEIDAADLAQYKEEIKKIEKLLKAFKPELNRIEVKYSLARGNRYFCKKTLVYKNDDKVDLEYESTGIKKLIRIFAALSSVDNGGVVFIDEFDANIHDVYLCKLIEYFYDYTNGQFIFTTHNLGPMEVLDKKELKHSIDFINKQTVSSWRKNGNYSVVKVYRNGMIPNSPFNINSVDFVKVFGGGKK